MIYITDYINGTKIEQRASNKIIVYSWEQTLAKFDKIEVLLVWHEVINEKYLQKFPNLKGIVRYGVGFDNVDLKACKKRKLIVCNNPDYGVDEVSDTALAMILSFARGLNLYNDAAKNLAKKRSKKWQEFKCLRLRRLKNLNIGIIGAGRIGSALARKSLPIFKEVSFYDPYKPLGYEKSICCKRYFDLEEILSAVDVVSIHVPLNKETTGIIDNKFIEKMKKNAILVNTARGGLIKDLYPLINAVSAKKLLGLGLDVLPTEPPDSNLILTLEKWISNDPSVRNNIIINPHTSYFSRESYQEMRYKASYIASQIIKGQEPHNRIL